MYLSLIDTVTKIVKSYGVGILSDSKFWHVLTDSYSFASEYSLKDTFKSCITTGYVSRLVYLKGNAKKTKDEISHIVKSESKINPGKEQEYAAVLYSVAIAIGSCTKKDYLDWDKSQGTQQKNPDNHPRKYSIFGWTEFSLSNYASCGWGIVVWILSASLYGLLLFCNFPFWLLIFITAILQLSYCSYLLRLSSNNNNDISKSLSLPIVIAFFLTDCIAIGLCVSRDFLLYLWSFFSGNEGLIGLDDLTYSSLSIWGEFDEVGGLFTFIMSLLLLFCIGSCFIRIISNQFSLRNRTLNINWISVLISSIIILLISSVTYSIYNHKNERTKECYLQSQQDISDKNGRLHKSRQYKSVALSFKGVRLGIDFATCIGYADSIFISQDNESTKYEIAEIKDYDDKSITHFSRVIKGTTDWDNQTVKLSIYEYNDKVGEIRVEPDNNSYRDGFDDYSRILNLYSNKYGEPEQEIWSPILRYFKESGLIYRDYDWTHYYWEFKNGAIKLDFNSIIYQSNEVLSYLRAQEIKQEQEAYLNQQRLKREQERLDSINKEEVRKDSIQRKINRKNAINEI